MTRKIANGGRVTASGVGLRAHGGPMTRKIANSGRLARRRARVAGAVAILALLGWASGCGDIHGTYHLGELDVAEQPGEIRGGDRVRLAIRGDPVVVPEGSRFLGSVVVLGGDARVDGRVDGEVVVLAGDLQVGPRAHVRGALVSVGNRRTVVSESARVDGSRVAVDWAGVRWIIENLLWGLEHAVANAVVACLGLLALVVLTWWGVIRRYDAERFHAAVDWRPVRAGLLGFLILLGVHVLAVLAFFSRYGMGLVPVFSLAAAALGVVGWILVATHLGRLIARRSGWRMGPFLYGILGVGLACLAFLVPVAGQVVNVLAGWVGVGALLAPGNPPPETSGDPGSPPQKDPGSPPQKDPGSPPQKDPGSPPQ